MLDAEPPLALTFDDVLLVPRHSTVLPREVDVSARLTDGLRLQIPLLSAAMDTVTEAGTAVAMAREGGIGILHKNMTPAAQAAQVRQVKRAVTGTVTEPVTVAPDLSLADARRIMQQHDISGLPVVVEGRAVGIITNRDLRFERRLDRQVREVMSEQLVTVPPGTGLERAKDLLQEHKIEKLLVVDDEGRLRGLDHDQGHRVARPVSEIASKTPRVGSSVVRRSGSGRIARSGWRMLVEAGVDLLVDRHRTRAQRRGCSTQRPP